MRLPITAVVPLLFMPGCITIWTTNRIAPHHAEVSPSRIEVVKASDESSYHVLLRYEDGSGARWILSRGLARETSPDAPLPVGEPVLVTSFDSPSRDGPRVRVKRDSGKTYLVVEKNGIYSGAFDVDADRFGWWRAPLWVVSLPIAVALDVVTWPMQAWAYYRISHHVPPF